MNTTDIVRSHLGGGESVRTHTVHTTSILVGWPPAYDDFGTGQ